MQAVPLPLQPNRACERLLRRLPRYRFAFSIVVLTMSIVFFVRAALDLM